MSEELKRALKYEKQLHDVTENYEEKLKQREIMSDKQKKELINERKKQRS
jgi:hypothetical protein